MPTKIFQLHKRSSYSFKNIQDKFSFNEKFKTIAVADGTTQSFRSELWAEIIAKEFVLNPVFEKKELIKLIKDSEEKFNLSDFKFSENPAKAYLEKQKISSGATSTLLGIRFQDDYFEVITCGDSNVFILKENGETDFFPFNDIEELDYNKDFINTTNLNEIEESNFKYHKYKLIGNEKIILCTDALSRLILNDNSIMQKILNFKNYTDFFDFCILKWNEKELQEDDITLVVIDGFQKINPNVFLPDANFEFDKEKEYEFIPTQINEIDMSNYNDLIDSLKKEFAKINNKISRIESLIIVLLIFIVSNFALNFYTSFHALDENAIKIKKQYEKISNEFLKADESDNVNYENDNPKVKIEENKVQNQEHPTKQLIKKDTINKNKHLLKDTLSKNSKSVAKDTVKNK